MRTFQNDDNVRQEYEAKNENKRVIQGRVERVREGEAEGFDS